MLPRFPDFDYRNLAGLMARLKKLLPPEYWLVLETVSGLAQAEGQTVYLVGGLVRDLILGRANFDMDFVCLKDALKLARRLLPRFEALPEIATVKLTEHPAFRTVRFDLAFTSGTNLHLDLATARYEIYSKPAALPTVAPEPATLEEDLRRRDFTINAMALSLIKGLVDPFNGLEDLRTGTLRVLHSASFEDDPTRMVRGVRYAARYGYHFEPKTTQRLEEAMTKGFFTLLSVKRKYHELRLLLEEAQPENGLDLLQNYQLLQAIQPGLTWNETLKANFYHLREHLPFTPSATAYLATLLHLAGPIQAKAVADGLHLSQEEAHLVISLAQLWQEIRPKLIPNLKNSQLYALLHPYNAPAEILATFEALLPEPKQVTLVEHYRKELADLRPQTNGDFLIKQLGLRPGPHFKEWLAALLAAVLDGEVQGREAEEAFLRHRAFN
ncbi:MAG: CCA tRNA nucleotidyltransferase [Chloroflexi bacterium]|nr:CCA tRNA nucleotidyltransferase [Chloroflexota bacterium]